MREHAFAHRKIPTGPAVRTIGQDCARVVFPETSPPTLSYRFRAVACRPCAFESTKEILNTNSGEITIAFACRFTLVAIHHFALIIAHLMDNKRSLKDRMHINLNERRIPDRPSTERGRQNMRANALHSCACSEFCLWAQRVDFMTCGRIRELRFKFFPSYCSTYPLISKRNEDNGQ